MINKNFINNKKRVASFIFGCISALIGLFILYNAVMVLVQGSGFSKYHLPMLFTSAYLILILFKTILIDSDAKIINTIAYIVLGVSQVTLSILKLIDNDDILSILGAFMLGVGCLFFILYKGDYEHQKYFHMYAIILGVTFKCVSVIMSNYSLLRAVPLYGEVITTNSLPASLLGIVAVIVVSLTRVFYVLSFSDD